MLGPLLCFSDLRLETWGTKGFSHLAFPTAGIPPFQLGFSNWSGLSPCPALDRKGTPRLRTWMARCGWRSLGGASG